MTELDKNPLGKQAVPVLDRSPTFWGMVSLMIEAEKASETLGFCPELTQLVAREDFI
jgi:hypothetical protein